MQFRLKFFKLLDKSRIVLGHHKRGELLESGLQINEQLLLDDTRSGKSSNCDRAWPCLSAMPYSHRLINDGVTTRIRGPNNN